MNARLDHLDLLRAAGRAAADRRKLFLALYGLLLFLPLALLVLACGRAALHGDLVVQISETFVRPVQATGEFVKTAFHGGRWLLMALVLLGVLSYQRLPVDLLPSIRCARSLRFPRRPRPRQRCRPG